MDRRGVEPLFPACKAGVLSRYTNSPKLKRVVIISPKAKYWSRTNNFRFNRNNLCFIPLLGFEPRMTDPESAVLPITPQRSRTRRSRTFEISVPGRVTYRLPTVRNKKHLKGVEPSPQPWQGRVLAVILQVHKILGWVELNHRVTN